MGLWNRFFGRKQEKQRKFGDGDSPLRGGNASIEIFVFGPIECGVRTLIKTFVQDSSVEIKEIKEDKNLYETQVTLDGTSWGLKITKGFDNERLNELYIPGKNLFLVCFHFWSAESFEDAKFRIRRIAEIKRVEEYRLNEVNNLLSFFKGSHSSSEMTVIYIQ